MTAKQKKSEKKLSPLQQLLAERLPGQKFLSSDYKIAGKKLAREGADAAVAYLDGRANDSTLKAPAKCSIVAVSRPLDEWPISKASTAIQRHVYARTVTEIASMRANCGKYNFPSTKEAHNAWFEATGVNNYGYYHVQGLMAIFKSALNTFEGVITKAENRNKKRRARHESINNERLENGLPPYEAEPEEKAVNDEGYLLHPPGVNPNILLYAGVPPKPFVPGKQSDVTLPAIYAGYNVDPDAPIPSYQGNRLDIPEGEPGHVPAWQREKGLVSGTGNKRRRSWWCTQNYKPKPGRVERGKTPRRSQPDPTKLLRAQAAGALLAIVRIGEDWIVFDVRGLLRSARWRGVAPKELTLNGLLELFTGDPVIDPRRNLVTFMYKPQVLGIRARKPISKGDSVELFNDLTKPTDDGKAREVGVLSVDLGQTHPIAAQVYRAGRDNEGAVKATLLDAFTLPEELRAKIASYRVAHDAMLERFRREALSALSAEHRAEFTHLAAFSNEVCKSKLKAIGVDLDAMPWDKMSGFTTYISDYLLTHGGDTTNVFFEAAPRKSKGNRKQKTPPQPKTVKRTDYNWKRLFQPQVSREARQAFNDKMFELQRTSPEFQRLSKRKKELARQCRNYAIKRARDVTQCATVVLVIEALNVRMMNGKGKRIFGWNGFFEVKRENRWFIPTLHGAFAETAPNRGYHVIEAWPAYTSMTCPRPECRHCDSANRDQNNRECFRCVKCGFTFHADREVAPANLVHIALTGTNLPGPARERSRADKKAGGARKAKKELTSKVSPPESASNLIPVDT